MIDRLLTLISLGHKHRARANPVDSLQKYLEANYPKEKIPYDELQKMRDYCNEPVDSRTGLSLKASDDPFSLNSK